MAVTYSSRTLKIDELSVEMQWPILAVAENEDKVFVLLDPDTYLSDITYKTSRRHGAPAVYNLIAVGRAGERLWEAEYPEPSDYYYKLTSVSPLVAMSFSSYRCEIDVDSGRIVNKEFLK
jgi:hypothetical protein